VKLMAAGLETVGLPAAAVSRLSTPNHWTA
jgi:hypothetical protein